MTAWLVGFGVLAIGWLLARQVVIGPERTVLERLRQVERTKQW